MLYDLTDSLGWLVLASYNGQIKTCLRHDAPEEIKRRVQSINNYYKKCTNKDIPHIPILENEVEEIHIKLPPRSKDGKWWKSKK